MGEHRSIENQNSITTKECSVSMPKKLNGKSQRKIYLASRFFSWAKQVVTGFCDGKPVKTGFSAAAEA